MERTKDILIALLFIAVLGLFVFVFLTKQEKQIASESNTQRNINQSHEVLAVYRLGDLSPEGNTIGVSIIDPLSDTVIATRTETLPYGITMGESRINNGWRYSAYDQKTDTLYIRASGNLIPDPNACPAGMYECNYVPMICPATGECFSFSITAFTVYGSDKPKIVYKHMTNNVTLQAFEEGGSHVEDFNDYINQPYYSLLTQHYFGNNLTASRWVNTPLPGTMLSFSFEKEYTLSLKMGETITNFPLEHMIENTQYIWSPDNASAYFITRMYNAYIPSGTEDNPYIIGLLKLDVKNRTAEEIGTNIFPEAISSDSRYLFGTYGVSFGEHRSIVPVLFDTQTNERKELKSIPATPNRYELVEWLK